MSFLRAPARPAWAAESLTASFVSVTKKLWEGERLEAHKAAFVFGGKRPILRENCILCTFPGSWEARLVELLGHCGLNRDARCLALSLPSPATLSSTLLPSCLSSLVHPPVRLPEPQSGPHWALLGLRTAWGCV